MFSGPSRPSAPPPARSSAPAPSPFQQQSSGGGGMLSNLGGMVAQGAAWGVGTSLAREAVGSVLHGGSSNHNQQQAPPPPQPQDACFSSQKAFLDCLDANQGQMDACAFYFDTLQACKRRMNA